MLDIRSTSRLNSWTLMSSPGGVLVNVKIWAGFMFKPHVKVKVSIG